MGMLMHHTWLKQQEDAAKKPVKQEKPAEEKEQVETAEPAKKTGGRRKAK